jgi:hypothetical protein
MSGSTTLKKITNRAKQIRRAHPNTSWISAVKKAGAEYRGGKKTRSTTKKRKPAAKPKRVGSSKKRSTPAAISGFSTAQLRSHLKREYKNKLAWGLLAVDSATKVNAKKKARKRVANIKKNLKALQ